MRAGLEKYKRTINLKNYLKTNKKIIIVVGLSTIIRQLTL
jgi:hypothetical protein